MSLSANAPATSAKTEWANHWYLPIVAALGYSAAGLHVYGIGPLMEPIHREFGWTRAQTLSGSAMVSFVIALASVPMGVLIDRLGPRRIALIGLLLIGGAVALLGTATGSMANWLALWALVAICSIPVQATVWTSAVVSRFDASRGLALAVTLCGASIGAFAFPLLSTWLVETSGWRQAFFGLGGIWALALLPLVFLFFRGVQDSGSVARRQSRAAGALLPGLTLAEAVRTSAFYRLLFATLFFTFSIFGCVVNFVPILTGSGAAPMTAASAASLVGIFSLIGRLGTGAVLDRLPAHIVGAICFLIPIPACALLLLDISGIGVFRCGSDVWFDTWIRGGRDHVLGHTILWSQKLRRHSGRTARGNCARRRLGAARRRRDLRPLRQLCAFFDADHRSHVDQLRHHWQRHRAKPLVLRADAETSTSVI